MAHAGKLTALLSAARQEADPVARERAYEELLRLLTIFVRAGMGDALRRHRESVDICQSVAKSFVVDLRDGRVEFPTEGALVAYLQQVVRTKLAQAARHDGAIKRGGAVAVRGLAPQSPSGSLGVEPAAPDPTASMVAGGQEARLQILRDLTPDERELIRLRQAGLDWEDIAARLGRSGPAVRKAWSRLQERARNAAGED